MAKFFFYAALVVCTTQWVYAENPFELEDEDIFSENTPFIDHGTNLFEGDGEYSLLDELENEHASSHNVDAMTTLDKDKGDGQINSAERTRLESLIFDDERHELGEMSADSNGPTCSACFGNDLASCARSAKVVKCASNKQCYTVHLTAKSTGGKTVIKGCLDVAKCLSDMCQKITNSSDAQYSFCNTKCCKNDLCNQVSAPVTPSPRVPTAPKCRHCQGLDEASCEARTTIKQCDSDHKCAAVYVTQKIDGKGVLAKGCISNKICDSGLCKALTKKGKYSFCKGSCCVGSLCTKDVEAKPTTKPTTTARPVSTEPPIPKCFACYAQSEQECDQRITVKQCEAGQRCYTANATLKSNGRTTFTRNCIKQTPEECQLFCKKHEKLITNCTYDCCEGNLCNRPDGFTTQAPTTPITHAPVTVHTYTQPSVTQRPVTPKGLPLLCYHCNSKVSEGDCESRRELRQCPGGRVCYTGHATYMKTGQTIIAKGCMLPDECQSVCKRHGNDVKTCSVLCCRQNACNAMKLTPTLTPQTMKPTIGNPSLRALVALIQAFKGLLDAIEISIRVSATDFKASAYKPHIALLMNQIESHAKLAPIKKNPAVKEAKREMSQLRRRAEDVFGKIENDRKTINIDVV